MGGDVYRNSQKPTLKSNYSILFQVLNKNRSDNCKRITIQQHLQNVYYSDLLKLIL